MSDTTNNDASPGPAEDERDNYPIETEDGEWRILCARCGEEATLPFDPGDRPDVYCRSCYDDVRRHDERLTLPHPGVTERAFVLVPLADIAPDLKMPGNDEPIGRLATRIDRGGLWPLEAIA